VSGEQHRTRTKTQNVPHTRLWPGALKGHAHSPRRCQCCQILGEVLELDPVVRHLIRRLIWLRRVLAPVVPPLVNDALHAAQRRGLPREVDFIG